MNRVTDAFYVDHIWVDFSEPSDHTVVLTSHRIAAISPKPNAVFNRDVLGPQKINNCLKNCLCRTGSDVYDAKESGNDLAMLVAEVSHNYGQLFFGTYVGTFIYDE